MKGLLAVGCCCEQEPVSECWRAWLDCPEYVKITLPGVLFENYTIVCVPYPYTEFWYPRNSSVLLSGTSPYPNGFEVIRDISTVKARDILFRKHVTCAPPGCPVGAPSYVEYRPVPNADQTGILELSRSKRMAGTFAGYQQGGPMPMVFDEETGVAQIPLRGQLANSVGSVIGAEDPFGSMYSYLRVVQPPTPPGEIPICRVELRIDLLGTAYGATLGIVPAKTLPSIDLTCLNQGYSYTADLGGVLLYQETWEPIDLVDFFQCPHDMDDPQYPSQATYYAQLGATESRTQIGPCDDLDPVCCCANGCFPSSTGCIGKVVTTGLGRAILVGTNSP